MVPSASVALAVKLTESGALPVVGAALMDRVGKALAPPEALSLL
jgi:hypothetical protein